MKTWAERAGQAHCASQKCWGFEQVTATSPAALPSATRGSCTRQGKQRRQESSGGCERSLTLGSEIRKPVIPPPSEGLGKAPCSWGWFKAAKLNSLTILWRNLFYSRCRRSWRWPASQHLKLSPKITPPTPPRCPGKELPHRQNHILVAGTDLACHQDPAPGHRAGEPCLAAALTALLLLWNTFLIMIGAIWPLPYPLHWPAFKQQMGNAQTPWWHCKHMGYRTYCKIVSWPQ